MTLYQIDEQIREAIEKLFDSINEETGEVDEGAAKELEELQAAREEKLDACGAMIKNLEAEAKAIKEEAETLKKRAEQKQKNADRLRDYVSASLQQENRERFESSRVVFSFRKSEQVQILADGSLPRKYIVKTVTEKPDKVAIKEALKAGMKVKGAELITKKNLQVK